jgi:hypothetical protein
MKINWGTKIAILYISFALLIVTLVFLSMRQKIDLESKDYYAKELAFQSRIDATNKANSCAETIQYEFKKDAILLHINPVFLSSDFKGDVYFYRASDSDMDKRWALQFDADGNQVLPLSDFKKGTYEMELNWQSRSENYFKKISIRIQ